MKKLSVSIEKNDPELFEVIAESFRKGKISNVFKESVDNQMRKKILIHTGAYSEEDLLGKVTGKEWWDGPMQDGLTQEMYELIYNAAGDVGRPDLAPRTKI